MPSECEGSMPNNDGPSSNMCCGGHPSVPLEKAEQGLFEAIEKRRVRLRTNSGESWQASVDGERPPLGVDIPFGQVYNVMNTASTATNASTTGNTPSPARNARKRFRDIAQKVVVMNKLTTSEQSTVSSVTTSSTSISHHHRRSVSKAHALLESIQESATGGDDDNDDNESKSAVFEQVGRDTSAPRTSGLSAIAVESTDMERLVAGAMQIEQLFADKDSDDAERSAAVEASSGSLQDDECYIAMQIVHGASSGEESIPLTSSHGQYGSVASLPARLIQRQKPTVRKGWRWVRQCCYTNPYQFVQKLWSASVHSFSFTVGLPCVMASLFLFYHFGNPTFDFVPGKATLSWWLNFVSRQCVTLDIARFVQWLIIDKLILQTRATVRCLGPLLSLYFIQARGYPFVMFAWGATNLFLLHGSNEFDMHWLFFTHIRLYYQANSGAYVLKSDLYFRVLLSLILAGVATAGKRATVAMYFGRRMFAEFKPRLEKILRDVVTLHDVAELAEQIEAMAMEADEAAVLQTQMRHHDSRGLRHIKDDLSWGRGYDRSLKVSGDESSDDEESDFDQGENMPLKSLDFNESSRSGNFELKTLLDDWVEPVNKLDKSTTGSINDILKFRRALMFMDDDQPFGVAFGPASTRDEFLNSAQAVFRRLLRMTPDRDKVSADVFIALAQDENGEIDRAKKKALHKLFRPDAENELGLLAFLQSADSVYRRLRFFRASVGNASVIDHALESIIDAIFNFGLLLILLSVMRFNPWPLLVSMSTIIVSVSFAVSSSCSNFIEGLLLICLRRPFDLGDRIYMQDPSALVADQGIYASWFVEDINLFYTTVRYAGTNEVATINNGSIASMRVVNANRSPNAMVCFKIPLHISAVENNMAIIEHLKSQLDKYAKSKPRRWHSFAYCRADEVETEQEKIVLTIGFQHRMSWQDLGSILFDKSELKCFAYEVSKELGVVYDELPKRELLYYAGALKSGKSKTYRKILHDPDNIQDIAPEIGKQGRLQKVPSDVAQKAANEGFLELLRQSH